MTSSPLPVLFLAAAAAVLSSCSGVSVQTDYDATANFAKYRTYAIAPPPKGEQLSPSGRNALYSSLRAGLAAKGLREVSTRNADLAVVRHAFTQDKVSVQQFTDWGYGYGGGWPYRYGYYGMWYGAPRVYTDVRQYTEGTLILDFVDNKTKRLVFRGTGRGTLSTPQRNAQKIQEAVTRIVARYPAPTVAPAQ